MKKICMLLVLLSGVAFAASSQGNSGCKVQELGECQFLYSCENSISMIVTKKALPMKTVLEGGNTLTRCDDTIVKRELIDIQNKKIVNIDTNK